MEQRSLKRMDNSARHHRHHQSIVVFYPAPDYTYLERVVLMSHHKFSHDFDDVRTRRKFNTLN